MAAHIKTYQRLLYSVSSLNRPVIMLGMGLFFLFLMPSCYSFKGIAIPPEVETYFIDNFQNGAPRHQET